MFQTMIKASSSGSAQPRSAWLTIDFKAFWKKNLIFIDVFGPNGDKRRKTHPDGVKQDKMGQTGPN